MIDAVSSAAEQEKQAYARQAEEDRPLGGYLVLLSTYATLAGGLALGIRARGRKLPERIDARDVALLGVATHKIARMLAKDPVFSSVRAPFARYEGVSGPAELKESPRGRGLRHALGELFTCPFCLAQWVATGLVAGMVTAPRLTRITSTVFAIVTISDSLQLAYAKLEQQA